MLFKKRKTANSSRDVNPAISQVLTLNSLDTCGSLVKVQIKEQFVPKLYRLFSLVAK